MANENGANNSSPAYRSVSRTQKILTGSNHSIMSLNNSFKPIDITSSQMNKLKSRDPNSTPMSCMSKTTAATSRFGDFTPAGFSENKTANKSQRRGKRNYNSDVKVGSKRKAQGDTSK